MIVLLVLNIIVCSINRLSATWKVIFTKNPVFKLSRFQGGSDNERFAKNSPVKSLKNIYAEFLNKRFGYIRVEETSKGFTVFAEKWRWTLLGVYFVHISIVFLLAGALIGSMYGFDGYVRINEGESVNSINLGLGNKGKTRSIGFDIFCEDFDVSFYDSGMPKEFRSRLAIIENGKAVYKKDIVVNDPIRYKGINIFQSSYGLIKPEDVILKITSKKTGMVYEKKAVFGQEIVMPENTGFFVLIDYHNSYSFRGKALGETFFGKFVLSKGGSETVALPIRYPSFDKMRKGDIAIEVADYKKRYYTGLQVTKDPGVWVVYAGFIIMIAGCYITFFMPHQRLCIDVVKKGDQCEVMVAGSANKNKLGMQNKVKKISKKLSEL